MTDSLKLLSYNCHGLNAVKAVYLREISSVFDFILLQETWLYEDTNFFDENLQGFRSHTISGMDISKVNYGRPYGGCSILWKEDLLVSVTPVSTHSNRLCAVIIKNFDYSILLFNVYMPCDSGCLNDNEQYSQILLEIAMLCEKSDVQYVAIGGDFNTDFSRNSSVCHRLKTFMTEECMCCVSMFDQFKIDYTFESMANGSKSLIDHFVVSENLVERICEYKVYHNADNLSDHSPISIILNLPSEKCYSTLPQLKADLCWSKATVEHTNNYKEMLNSTLDDMTIPWDAIHCNDMNCSTHTAVLESFCNNIVEAFIKSGDRCIPLKHRKGKSVPGWENSVKEKGQSCIFWHNIWKDNGSPTNGVLYDIRKHTRAQYHYALRYVHNNKMTFRANRLADYMINNQESNFWQEIQKMNGNTNRMAKTIDNGMGDENICNIFAEKYESLYSSVSYNSTELSWIKEKIANSINTDCALGKCYSRHKFSVTDVYNAIKQLKLSKGDGKVKCMSNYIINATGKAVLYLSLLFNSIISHGFVPNEMLLSTLIPIPKNKRKSVNDSSNYRGITLSSILGKLLDVVVLKSNANVFKSSHLQFGFKEKHSTGMCTFVLNEVAKYYNNKRTNVHCMLIDASQAFDRVDYVKLFSLLVDKKLCPVILRFLLSLYTRQKLRVKWGNSFSPQFDIKNGVKQGGVLSPILFAMYMDILLERLEASGFGCHIGNQFVGAIAYADDITLMAPSSTSLKLMLDIVNNFGMEYSVKFNPSKSIYTVLGNTETPSYSLCFNDIVIHSVKSTMHLGHEIGLKAMESNIQRNIRDCVKRFNVMLSVFKHCSHFVKYKLFKTYCMALYGSPMWDLSSAETSKFYVTWRKCVRQLLNLSPLAHGAYLHKIVNDLSIENQLMKRFLKFFNSIVSSDNPVVRLCGSLVVNGSNSYVCRSLNFTRLKHNINCPKESIVHIPDVLRCMRIKENDDSGATDLFNISNIIDLLYIREHNVDVYLNHNEINCLLNYFSIT